MLNNTLYGGINYPGTSFVFDRVYANKTEMMAAIAVQNNGDKKTQLDDGVLVGRYVIVKYCDKAFTQDERNVLNDLASQNSYGSYIEDSDEYVYITNCIADRAEAKDRVVYRKKYNTTASEFEYEEFATLHSTVSDESIAVLGIAENDKILATNSNRILSSTLNLIYEDNELKLIGIDDVQINTPDISTAQIFGDRVKNDDKILFYKDNKLQTDVSLQPIVNGIKITAKNAAGQENNVTSLPLVLTYDSNDQYIKIKSGDIVISGFDASAFVKDSFLSNVSYDTDTNSLSFEFITYDITTGTQEIKTVNIDDIDIMDAGNGIAINGNKISAITSGDYLTVDGNGIHTTTALDTAIANAKNEAIAAAANTVTIVTDENLKGSGTNIGDICIVKTPIENTNNKYSHTAYTWNGSGWAAMDGNYNAENIYFDDNIMVTKEIGYVTLTNGNGYIQSKGKNLVQVFDSMFTKEQDPSKTEPSVSITLNKAGAYEVGTTVENITCDVSFSDGSYSYGPEPTGAAVSSWEIKDTKNKTYAYSTSSIAIDNVLITDNINYTITAKATHSAGYTPQTNKGNDCIDINKKIAAGTKSKTSSAITGYRKAFAGGTVSTTIDSDVVRSMTATKNSANEMNSFDNALDFSASKGAMRVFFAYPATWTGTPYVEMFSTAWLENVNFIQQSDIQVADAREDVGYAPYKLYAWILNTPLEADNTNFKVWFK